MNRADKIAHAISAFVENPITNLAKGIALFSIGIAEASRTFVDDVTHGHVRVGHGLVIIGFFGILEALPHLIEGLDASRRFFELRAKKAQSEPNSETGPKPGEDERRS
jgi:hypothetical protein